MDNSWQSKCGSIWQSSTPSVLSSSQLSPQDSRNQSKCGSIWQSSTPLAASSSQLPPHESRNQMLNAGHHFYPHVMQEPSSSVRGMMLEPTFPYTSNISFYNSGHAELGSSYFSLLSGPPSLLQCDLQQLSNPKPFTHSSKGPLNSSSVMVSAAGTGVSLAPTGLLSQIPDKRHLKIGVDCCPVVSARAMASANCGSASCLHEVLQAANLNLQSSVRHNVSGIEKAKDSTSLRGRWLASPSPASVGKLHSSNIQGSQKVLETNSSVPRQSSPLTSDCPRVFCLGASGDLLLSKTGLLGVVCSCHGLHMSISKFFQHSGLRDINPGDAVYMDSGETISQWRKVYFPKFGIRVPESHSGWDWPEGFSAAAGSMKCSATVPKISRSSDLLNLVGPSEAMVASVQPLNNIGFSRSHHTSQKAVNEVQHNEKQRNGQDGWNFLNGFIGTSQSNLRAVADKQIMEFPMSGCSTMPKLVGIRGPDNGSEPISTYIDSISRSGNSFISLPNLQNLKTPDKGSEFIRFSNSKEGDVVDRTAVTSNVELRLGQPSQQSQTLGLGNSFLPAFGSRLIGTHYRPQISVLPEQLIYNTGNTRATEECRQYLQSAAGTSKYSTRREQSQLSLVNHAARVYSAVDAAHTEQFRGDAGRGSVISMLLSSSRSPSEGKKQSATTDVVSGSHVISGKPLCESHVAKSDPNHFTWNRGKGTETQFDVNEWGIHKHLDKGKGVGCASDGAHVPTESNFGFHTNYKGRLSSSSGVGETGRYTCSAAHDKSSHPCQLSDLPDDASDARNPSNYHGKVSCLGRNGHFDHGFFRSVSLPMDSGPIFPLQAVSMGLSCTTSICVPNPTPTLSNKDGLGLCPYFLNENLGTLALKHVLELSNQEHAIADLGTNQGGNRFNSSCGDKIQGSIVHPSTSTEQRHGPNLASKQDASEVDTKSLKSGATYWMGGDSEKLTPVADMEMRCQFSHDPHPNEHPSLRLGRSEKNITPSCEQGKCCRRVPYAYFPGKCSCSVHTICLGGNIDVKGKPSLIASGEQTGSAGGRTPMLFGSNFDGDCTISKERAICIGQNGESNRQNSKKVECHAFQWRDVPSKVTGKDRPANLLDARGNVEDRIAAADAAKCFDRSVQDAESLKEQQMSNISSGCSAPAITEVAVKLNNEDSCTVDERDTRGANDVVVDEGSGIDKCWSSDDAPNSGSTEFDGFPCKVNSISKGSSKAFPKQLSRSLVDELRLKNSSKNIRNQVHSVLTIHEKTIHTPKFEKDLKIGKRKRATKWKKLDAGYPASGISSDPSESPKCIGNAERHSHSSKNMQILLQPDQGRSHKCSCSVGPIIKRRRSTLSSSKTIYGKCDLQRLIYNREGEIDCQTKVGLNDNCLEIPEASRGKRFRLDLAAPTIKQVWMQKPNCTDTGKTVKYNSVDCKITCCSQPVNVRKRKAGPVVCGKYGVISNGDTSKPVKIISIRKILKTARRCTLAENAELKLSSAMQLKKTRNRGSNGCSDKLTNYKDVRNSKGQDGYNESDPDNYVEETETTSLGGKDHDDESYMLEKESCKRLEKNLSIPDSCPNTRLKPKCKEVRKRSLYELTVKGKDSSCANFFDMKNSNCLPQTTCRYLGKFLKNAEDSKHHASKVYNANKSIEEHRCQSISNVDAFCCVCGSSNKDEVNCLLECNQCLIRVHQACYGVSKVPKVHWYCRPCRTSSKNIVCVLCGYEGGAMTLALRSRNIVKSLLKVWNFVTETKNPILPTEALDDQFNVLTSSRSGLESDSIPVTAPAHINSSTVALWEMDLQKQFDFVKISSCAPRNSVVQNSITAGVLDSTVKQWVHVVCGLWTPGTRCPNVDTMSAFDVSGASHPKVDVVCSMCNRPGGSCIECRVVDCSVQFHPWCAHQKGLLQSEVEGVDNENVGFYGRCELHAIHQQCNTDNGPSDTETGHPGDGEFTCARTEGYKGRKREGYRHYIPRKSDGIGGCLVPQEQLNAWHHINGQKSCTKGLPKLPATDIEYDCRKEYARYKQSKGWKHLVVYKSGIHALGLYTSRFISRGAMVVEYVGEIVGLRLADKRESEYQSGRKLQYKSACYFFRIDKEHIIDATCKGGIARFVNHSCLPNCVAKVISVRNEKKVVFFAERDIFPGEEITYDYHFSHEDEGKKIPCFCNSKNCRRYLN